VKIDLYKSENFYDTIAVNATGNGLYFWKIPADIPNASDYKIKITSIDQSAIYDFSNSTFTIYTGSVTVTSPKGGESWQAGTSQNIEWTDNIPEDITIDLYKGGSFHSIISTPTASDGSKSWDIPFALESGSDYKVKITSAENDSLFDFSDDNFTIVGNQITVTSPNGGEDWQVGKSQIITWEDNLTGNVEIQLYKGDIFNSSITNSTQSDGLYTWNISSTLVQGSDYRIRIPSVDDGNVFDFSDSVFTLSNDIRVTLPNGGESWQAGTAHNITWDDNISGNVRIELYKDSLKVSDITRTTESDGAYNWNIPLTTIAGSDYKVKIRNVDNAAVFDFSDSEFEIYEGSITVESPNGGESWQAGTSQNIEWMDNINEDVSIELYKGGSFHSIIATTTGSDGRRSWEIPFTLESGNDYTVKITSVDDPNITDFSDADFTIVGNQITVTAPNGGENWLDTDDQLITWTDNLAGPVEIQLLKGGVFFNSVTTSTPSDGSYTWNIPGSTPSGSDYKIKIISVDEGNIFDQSDNNFTIINNNITVTSPNGGENWLIGSTQEITWTDDISGDVNIDLYKDGVFNSPIASSVASTGTYSWEITGVTPGFDYRIKITSVDQPALFDMSNNDFTLFTGSITITSPNGIESWLAGSSQTIFWTDNLSGDVKIDLYKADTLYSIISGPTPSDGSKDWQLPFDIKTGNDYKVKITGLDNTEVFDFSDANFRIEGFEITITSPNGGEVWYVGQDYNITWNDNLEGNIDIQLWKGGAFHSVIDGNDPSDGIKTWSIPLGQETGSDFTIRIASTDNSNIFDFSDNTFTLAHQIIVETPNGGESWQAGSDQTISWSDNLTGNVEIQLFKGGVFHSQITNSTLSNGNFTWHLSPGLPSGTNYKVKIVSVEDVIVFDFSDDNFEIFAGSVTLVSPNGGEIWQAGSEQTISWTSDVSENVNIELYKGGSLHSTIVPSTGNDGTYNWTSSFTTESGSDYKVKISSVSNPNIFDFSDDNFTIVGNEITILSPNGGETWVIGEPYFITWEANVTGLIAIYLYKGSQLKSIIDGSDVNDGSYAWTIPGNVEPGSDYKIRIESRDNGNIFDESDAEFTITNVTGIENISNEIPDIFTLYQNYPNPFNPQTKIEFGLPEESTVSLKIYDLTGQEVDVVLNNEVLFPGKFRFDFDASYLPSGIYFYILLAKSNKSDLSIKETKKMILMK
ncbi:MAG: Ser-Thr-rich GPI-anchored membrane family protein, partial [Ignavibacteriaceae bacterium]